MFYTVYKTTNLVNGKIYIGSHKTKDLDDGYLGYGKYLRRAIEKHGVENFKKEILFVFDNPKEMYDKEAELVNEDFLAEENTYNLKVGGFGGFDHLNKRDTEHIARCTRGGITQQKRLKDQKRGRFSESYQNPFVTMQTELTERARKANLGSIWINNGTISKKIKKEMEIPSSWIKGRIKRGQQRAAGDPCKIAD